MHKRTYCIRSLEMRTMHTAFTHGAYFPGPINRFSGEKLCCWRLLNLTSTAKSGLWGTHEVALVECLPYPETPSVEETITIGGEHEENNSHARLLGDCPTGI